MRSLLILALLLPGLAYAGDATKTFEFQKNADMTAAQAKIVAAAKTVTKGTDAVKTNYRAAVVVLLAADVARRKGDTANAKLLAGKVADALSGKVKLGTLLTDAKLSTLVKAADAFVFDKIKLAASATRWGTVGFEPYDFQTK